MQSNRPMTSYSRWRIPTFLLVLFLVCIQFVYTQEKQFDDTNNSNKTYDWDSWDYYQILGLASTLNQMDENEWRSRRRRVKERTKIKPEDIKKAYRKQAQLWHPDKITSKKQLSGHTNNNNNTNANHIKSMNFVSLEESNARFARIAQAYETLSNENQRIEYDIFLLDQEDEEYNQRKQRLKEQQQQQQQQQQEKQKQQNDHHTYHSQENSFSTDTSFSTSTTTNPYTSFFHTDPWTLFEDFFFGSSSHSSFSDSSKTYDSSSSSSSSSYPSSQNSYTYPSSPNTSPLQHQPTRVSESTQVRYDAHLGAYVHRVLHREEYDDPYNPSSSKTPPTTNTASRSTYYRVIGQEFIEEFHPFHGYSLGYTPIADPYLVEEGFLPIILEGDVDMSPSDQETLNQDHFYQSNLDSQSPRRKRLKHTSSILSSQQYISTKNAQYLRSENNFYYAGLTPDCELVVMYDKAYETNNNTWIDDVLVWTSESYIPNSYLQTHGGYCFLALYQGQLAVVVGDNPDEPTSVLWSSPQPSTIRRHENDVGIDYFLSLDNDGSLVVYRRRIKTRPEHLQDIDEIIQEDSYKKNDDKEENFVHKKNRTNTNMDENPFKSFLESMQGYWKQWWLQAIQTTKRASRIPPKTHAARAWKSLQRWAINTLTGESVSSPHRSLHDFKQNFKVQNDKNYIVDECVFASSPVGCITSGRLFIQASKNVQRNIGKKFENLDKVWENFLVSISDRSDEDDDIIDTMMRLLDKVGKDVRKTGIKIAYKGMSGFHRAAKATQEAFQKSGWKEASEWSED